MKISLEKIKALRDSTLCGVIECKKALEEAEGNIQKAKEILRKKGLKILEEKKQHLSKEGCIGSYVHFGGKIAALVELSCETDFVARTEEFLNFAKDLAMQITATCPQYISREDVPKTELKEIEDKEKFFKEVCLLEQPFIKDQSLSIKDCLATLSAKIKENITIKRFVRFSLKDEPFVYAELKSNA